MLKSENVEAIVVNNFNTWMRICNSYTVAALSAPPDPPKSEVDDILWNEHYLVHPSNSQDMPGFPFK